MTELHQLESDLGRLRAMVGSLNVHESRAWTEQEKVRLSNEIRWCVDALNELGRRLTIVQR